MQSSPDAGSHRESDTIQETLQGQHKLSQPLDCRATCQVLTENVKGSAEKAKIVRCRTPNAGRLMAETTWTIDFPTVEQQAAPTRLGPHMQEVEDPISSREYTWADTGVGAGEQPDWTTFDIEHSKSAQLPKQDVRYGNYTSDGGMPKQPPCT